MCNKISFVFLTPYYLSPWLDAHLTTIQYVMYFRLLWMASCFHIIQLMGQNET